MDGRTARSPTVTHVYADGGCILGNPSEHGGTWAYLHVNGPADQKVAGRSGLITTARFGALVTNNVTEFYAVLKALEALPDGWSGPIHSDSTCTITRWRGRPRWIDGIPYQWQRRMAVVKARLGELDWIHLAGHPTAEELERGRRLKKLADGQVVE